MSGAGWKASWVRARPGSGAVLSSAVAATLLWVGIGVKGESRTYAIAISWGSTGAGLWFEGVEGAETMVLLAGFASEF